ncbi:aminotransferase class V-fold PLP-dependent enzyme [Colwellia psychrerythraea]|uniref:cysteine desulfurase n=1 Tax=Colwellia psychrerythraea TaxID=28229 RepID=A0A099K974_COLPS|nr:aminotransferase class V-fold PLP-dependent enzyme [Colwellia psychrerythraea]KGJ86921.1 Cysteine desulfurase, Hydroxyacylglutathione hydrolase [Colwellia psychrerythraea]
MNKRLSDTHQPLNLIYLDANATTQVLPQAASAALSTMETFFGNPSSSHVTGLQAKQIVDKTRQQAKRIVGTDEGKIIFTSGATEGIQTAILSALVNAKKTLNCNENYSLLYGATEHKAVPESLKHWNEVLELNAEIVAIPVNEKGQLDMEFIAKEVPNALMICTMAVNNETGVYQDISLLDQTIRANNPKVAWMVDCVQALGKTDLSLGQTTIDYAPFSGHKLYAPKGIGFMYVKENAPFTPFIAGGGQESGLRSGTENLPGLAALSVIFTMLLDENESNFTSVENLHSFRQQIVLALTQAFPEVVFNHSFENSVPTTINFAIPGLSSKEIMDLFDSANIRVSSGSACSSKITRSFVLDAMGLPAWQSESAIRMSFGPAMTQSEIDSACSRIVFAAQALERSCLIIDKNTIDTTTIENKAKAELNGLVQFKVGASCSWLYIDQKTKSAVFIDPLPELTDRLHTLLTCRGLELIAVIDTHSHADHISCRQNIAQSQLAEQQTNSLGWPADAKLTTINGHEYPYITLGDKWLINIATPGHTNDSISLVLCEPIKDSSDKLRVHYTFCGDLILMNSLGRTNFSNSSAAAMYSSLQLLTALIGTKSLLCPSHDYNNEFTSRIETEMARNSLLTQVINDEINAEEFSRQKIAMDKKIMNKPDREIMCGALIAACQEFMVREYTSASLAKAVKASTNMKLIDIREPHEYALQHDKKFTFNVPLTRLVHFVKNQQQKEQELVFVCRSGSRSQLAAQALARLGFNNVGHLKGGYALHQY